MKQRTQTTMTAIVAASLMTLGWATTSHAQQADGFSNPCEAAPITDFDFWVNDWVAYDYDSGVVQGVDRIKKINNGCVVYQEWSQMTDRYRSPGAPHRYAGISINSVLADGRWQQVWIGNGGGTITLTGGLDDEGRMVLTSPETPLPNGTIGKRTWYWEPQEDNTIHSWGENTTKDADGNWSEPTIPWNLRYVRRADTPNLVAGGN